MTDLVGAILILMAGSLAAGRIGFRLGKRLEKASILIVQLSVAAGLVLYMALLWDRPLLTQLLPVSSIVILGNWLPIFASFWVGMYIADVSINASRRFVLGSLAVLLGCYSIVSPLTGRAPTMEASANDQGIFQTQSTDYTCSAASAVTLLRMHQIPATERELAELCLTTKGTHWMGVYRGLSLKTSGTPWKVVAESVSSADFASLDETCLLSIDIDTSNYPEELDHGFHDAIGHTIVCLGQSHEGCLQVFDPSPDFGLETWGPSTYVGIESGVLLKLVRRDGRQATMPKPSLVALRTK